jgi:thiosulfate dehydrogenase (quinone) large subunit
VSRATSAARAATDVDDATDWRTRLAQPGWVVLPLRLFLGVTFVYAGLQKLIDHSYFDAASPQSVQQQMVLQSKTSPIGSLVGITAHHAVFFGFLILLGEIAVGLGALLGIWTRLAALGGLLLSLSFFLTVSFHTHPYFYGSDIVFVFAWITLLLSGDGAVLSVSAMVRRRVRTEMGLAPVAVRAEPQRTSDEVERRTVVRTGGIAAIVGLVTLSIGALARLTSKPSSGVGAAGPTTTHTPTPTTPGASTTPTPTPTHSAAPGVAVMAASRVAVGGAAPFQLPSNGEPAYVVQPSAGQYEAFTAVCTHAGCTVGFDGQEFACPCHGATYSMTTGQVTGGPAPAPLTKVNVTVVDGQVRVV